MMENRKTKTKMTYNRYSKVLIKNCLSLVFNFNILKIKKKTPKVIIFDDTTDSLQWIFICTLGISRLMRK